MSDGTVTEAVELVSKQKRDRKVYNIACCIKDIDRLENEMKAAKDMLEEAKSMDICDYAPMERTEQYRRLSS